MLSGPNPRKVRKYQDSALDPYACNYSGNRGGIAEEKSQENNMNMCSICIVIFC